MTARQVLACLAAVGAWAACQPSDASFWVKGEAYAVDLFPDQLPMAMGDSGGSRISAQDSVTVMLVVQDLQDSMLSGTYRGAVADFGLRVGRVTPGPQTFVGRLRADSFEIELTPDATDAGLWLWGSLTGHVGSGHWEVEQGAGAGRFRIRRR